MDEVLPDELGVVRIDDTELPGTAAGEAEASVGGNARDIADPGRYLEGDLRLAERCGLVQQGAVDDGVTGDEPYDLLALSGRLDHELHAVGVVKRYAVRPDRGNDLGVGSAVCLSDCDDISVDHDHIGVPEEGDGPKGQQVRIARASRYQRHRTEGDLATRLRIPWGGACGHGCLS
ncbi:unannotated protein [freshwater metagenome]|uniref:Unannotated protein n=1 Tax=freshwater metagenome TaxID=449393 RepID=A0A6J6UAG9_9ZZZZ